jgi:hypothetical protein
MRPGGRTRRRARDERVERVPPESCEDSRPIARYAAEPQPARVGLANGAAAGPGRRVGTPTFPKTMN